MQRKPKKWLCKSLGIIHATLCYYLNNSEIEQVSQFTYLGTIITSKLDFTLNTIKTSKKARKRLHIVSKLYHLGITEKLIHTCYKSFIESVLTYHLVVIYKHMSADAKKKLTSVVKSAEYLSGDLSFTNLADLYGNNLKVMSQVIVIFYTYLLPVYLSNNCDILNFTSFIGAPYTNILFLSEWDEYNTYTYTWNLVNITYNKHFLRKLQHWKYYGECAVMTHISGLSETYW